MATFLNDPLVLDLEADAAAGRPNQPLQVGTFNPAPTISGEVPADGSTVPPPLTLIQVLVN